MSSKSLLVITNLFPDKEDNYVGGIFVKEQLQYLKDSFENIYVVSPTPYGAGFLRGTKHEDYQFDNIRAFFPRYFNVPFLSLRLPLFFRGAKRLSIIQERRAILKFLEREKIKFDLIHAHFTWRSGATAVVLKKRLGVPLIITEPTSWTFRHAIRSRDPIFTEAWNQSDIIIRVRKEDIERFAELGIPLNKVHHVPHGFDHRKFFFLDMMECRKKVGLPLDKKIILTIGGLDEVKGHKYLIDAIGIITKQRTDVLCVLIGGGGLKRKLNKKIKRAGLEPFIRLVGGKPHDEIPTWINACDVVVMPSLAEGNPIVMFESLGCGKPFIGSRVGGIPEIITSDNLGFICDVGDSRALAEKIMVAIEKDWSAESIRKYALQFTCEKAAERITGLYDDVLKITNSIV